MRRFRWRHLAAVACLAAIVAGFWTLAGGDRPPAGAAYPNPTRGQGVVRDSPLPARTHDDDRAEAVTVVAAGDLSCDPANEMFNDGHGTRRWCRAEDTEALIASIDPDVVMPLGDTQYDEGRLAAYRASYALHWGLERDRTRAVVGNHEYLASPIAHGFFTYFGSAAGATDRGWYAFDTGAWHVVVLNSNCVLVGCGPGSRQFRWLEADLDRTDADTCTLVAFHHPRFSSGPHGDDAELLLLRPIWRLLYARGADLVINAHDHIYERFAPMDPRGRRDRAFGVREFIVGTGGAEHYWVEQVRYASQVRNVATFGVLDLTLVDGGYSWSFAPIDGFTFTDQGSDTCHGAPA